MKNTIKELELMATEAKRKRNPAVPPQYIPKAKFNTSNANGLTKAIITCINLHGGFATRINSQGQYDPGRKIWRPGSTVRGIVDVSAVYQGLNLSVEVKIGRDKLSSEQIAVKQKIENAGGHWFLAKDYDSFFKWFQSLTLTVAKL